MLADVRFSNRPFEVKHFQTIHHCSVDVAHGLALLFGIGTKALPLWDSRTRRNNLWVGLWVGVAVTPTAGPSGQPLIYPVHVTTRKSFGLMTRKLSVTESHRSAQFRGTFSRKKPSVASANWAQVA